MLERLLGEQLEDGGWNCAAPPSVRASFHSTICVLEGLLEYERANGATPAVTAARARGEAYLLERRMFRKLSSGEVIDRDLDPVLVPAGASTTTCCAGSTTCAAPAPLPTTGSPRPSTSAQEARRSDGRWPSQNPHADVLDFDLAERADEPSRWNTLRALRVFELGLNEDL